MDDRRFGAWCSSRLGARGDFLCGPDRYVDRNYDSASSLDRFHVDHAVRGPKKDCSNSARTIFMTIVFGSRFVSGLCVFLAVRVLKE